MMRRWSRVGASGDGQAANLCWRCRARRRLLMHSLLSLVVLASASLIAATAQAHPHVWVTMRMELIYDPTGSVTGVRHAWTFDEMYSAFATQGLEAKTEGQFTREELQSLAQVNAESLKEFNYFTNAAIDGKKAKAAFADPVDYWLDYEPKAQLLTLHFTLPFKAAVKAKLLTIQTYDPEFFIDFEFADHDSVKLVGAPSQCAGDMEKLNESNVPAPQRLDRSFMTSDVNAGMGANFANKFSVKCP
jgi:ABC-type uncharacterized transport system substrate-binding protein